MCAQQRLRPAWASAQSDQSLRSDLADAQADLSLCWAHMPFCLFCHDAAQNIFLQLLDVSVTLIILCDSYHHHCSHSSLRIIVIWAATWQNQQSECAPSEDSDQPGHPPNLIRVFAVRLKKPWTLNYPMSAQRRLWSDWADAQADLRLLWAHAYFVGFVVVAHIFITTVDNWPLYSYTMGFSA